MADTETQLERGTETAEAGSVQRDCSTAMVLRELNRTLEELNATFKQVGTKYTDDVMERIYRVSDEIVRLSKTQSNAKPCNDKIQP